VGILGTQFIRISTLMLLQILHRKKLPIVSWGLLLPYFISCLFLRKQSSFAYYPIQLQLWSETEAKVEFFASENCAQQRFGLGEELVFEPLKSALTQIRKLKLVRWSKRENRKHLNGTKIHLMATNEGD
jgi:hypothetical protein